MMDRRKLLAAGAALPLVLVSCGGKKASGAEPPAIKLGRDTCDRCGMVISEERFASGIVEESGQALIFDDPGEMVATIQEQGENGRRSWVHGSPSMKWMNAEDAFYAVTREVQTPMGTGVVPFDDESEATAFASERSGVVYSWPELLKNWSLDPVMRMG